MSVGTIHIIQLYMQTSIRNSIHVCDVPYAPELDFSGGYEEVASPLRVADGPSCQISGMQRSEGGHEKARASVRFDGP